MLGMEMFLFWDVLCGMFCYAGGGVYNYIQLYIGHEAKDMVGAGLIDVMLERERLMGGLCQWRSL